MKINEIEFKAPRFFSQEMQSENPFALNNMERTVSPALTVGMSGKVAAFVLFPESNGVTDANQEDWTVGQKNNVIWKVTNAIPSVVYAAMLFLFPSHKQFETFLVFL